MIFQHAQQFQTSAFGFFRIPAQGRLGPIALGDIEESRQITVTDGRAGNEVAALLAIPGSDPVLFGQNVAAALRRRRHGGRPGIDHPLPVGGIRVGLLPPVIERRQIGTAVAERLLEAGIAPDDDAAAVDVTQGDRRVIEQLLEARFAALLGCSRFPSGLSLPGILQLALHRGRQAREMVLHQVVAGARAHQLHRTLLADVARHHDEREVQRTGLNDRQRVAGREAG